MYYSQQGEDRFLYENYLNYREGFFIELGAMDGITFSNTLFFESTLGWKGILIEPSVKKSDLDRNRPNCFNFNCAISENGGDVEFVGQNALGGMKKTMSDKHYLGWGLDKLSSYTVNSKRIDDIIYEVNKSHKIDKIDLLSLDVEGGELEVLRSYPFIIPTKIVLIEMAHHDFEKDEKCRKILIENNFILDSYIGCNEVWININNMK